MKNLAILSILLAYLPVAVFGLGNITVEIYNPQNDSFFPATSVLIHTGNVEPEVILFDAQFSTVDGQRVLEMIKESGSELKHIIITSCGPANYFGLEPIMEAYPDAKILSTARTEEHIRTTKDAKLAHWARDLGDGAPTKLYVPQVINETTIVVAGETFDVHNDDDYAAYFYLPERKIILGGVAVYWNMHPYVVDAQTVEMRDSWREILREMIELEPEVVIPGHFLGERPACGDEAVRFTLEYLDNFEHVLIENNYKNSSVVIDTMIELYPELGHEIFLELSAKANTGET